MIKTNKGENKMSQGRRVRRIFSADDEDTLQELLEHESMNSTFHSKLEGGHFDDSDGYEYGFEVISLDVRKLMILDEKSNTVPKLIPNVEYLNEVGLWDGEDDSLLLDINFKYKKVLTEVERKRWFGLSTGKETVEKSLEYNGIDVLKALDELGYKCNREVESVETKIYDTESGEDVPEQDVVVEFMPHKPKVIVSTSMIEEIDSRTVNPDIAFVENYDVYGHGKATDLSGSLNHNRYAHDTFGHLVKVYDGKVRPLNQ